MTGIEQAVAAAGSQEALATAVGVGQPTVSKWVRRGCVPWDRINAVVAATGVSPRDLADPAIKALLEA